MGRPRSRADHTSTQRAPQAGAAVGFIEILASENCEWDFIESIDQLVQRVTCRMNEPLLARPVERHNATPTPTSIDDSVRVALERLNVEDRRLYAWALQNRPDRVLASHDAIETTEWASRIVSSLAKRCLSAGAGNASQANRH
jgi:hypothetical protein